MAFRTRSIAYGYGTGKDNDTQKLNAWTTNYSSQAETITHNN